MLTLLATLAFATTYNVTFCAEYDVVYADAGTEFTGDDYITDDGIYPARGARIKVVRNSDSAVMIDSYAQDTGGSAGCFASPLALDSTQTYDVKMKSQAYVSGNYLYVYAEDSYFTVYSYGPPTYSPTSSTTYTITPPSGVTQWNIANAIGHSMWRRNAGLTGEHFRFMNFDPEDIGGWYDKEHDWVYIHEGTADDKYVISHEFGHMLAARANYGAGCGTDSCSANYSYGADKNGCYTDSGKWHELHSKEYQSAALSEGIAHYYAAAAYNQTDQADCTFVYYKNIDWDLVDGATEEEELSKFEVSCETYPSLAPYADYLTNQCIDAGVTSNRGTEYDWLRFFWDLDYDQAVSTTDIFRIWDDADPDDWAATGNGSDPDDGTPCSLSPYYPVARLRCAADGLGLLAEWDAEDTYNGTWR